MVKVIEKSEEEKQEERKAKSMLEIAVEIYGNDKVTSLDDNLVIFIRQGRQDPYISIRPIFNGISVYDHNHFEEAMKLARKYEEELGIEITLKKEY